MRDELRERFEQALRLFDRGRADEAVPLFEECRRSDPADPNFALNLGHALAAAGDPERAAGLYRDLLNGSDMAMVCAAAWSLADLKDSRFTTAEIDRMSELAEKLNGHPQRFLLLFALGHAHEQTGEHERAFGAWREANAQAAKRRPFDGAAWNRLADSLRSTGDVSAPAKAPAGPRPVFIVGMPRSGSTLVEQILGAHSQVEATSELPFMENIARELDRMGGYAVRLPRLTPDDCTRAAAAYRQQAASLLRGSKPFFTDKWPNNFWHVPLIRALFPDAPIINVVRDPVDNAMAVFKQYFNHGNEHSFRLDWTAAWWETYLDVMSLWEDRFPGAVLHLAYRDLVSDPEVAVKRLLAHCDLPYEPEVLQFHRRDRTVMTPSAQQVRKPIHTGALDSSLPYRPFMQELMPRFEAIKEKAGTLPGL